MLESVHENKEDIAFGISCSISYCLVKGKVIMQKKMVGLIPAAGKGMRAYPSSSMVPKPLFEINGKSILQRNIEIMRDKFGIEEISLLS